MKEAPKPFASLGLTDELAKALEALSITHATPIQQRSFRKILEGKSVVMSSVVRHRVSVSNLCSPILIRWFRLEQTGSGKTFAYLLPLLQRLAVEPSKVGERKVAVLILIPTTTLATQICDRVRHHHHPHPPTTPPPRADLI